MNWFSSIIIISICFIKLFFYKRIQLLELKRSNLNNANTKIKHMYENYLPLRNIDPSFIIYNTTYKEVVNTWKNTVYYTHDYLVNALATKKLNEIHSNNEIYRCALICNMVIDSGPGCKLLLEDPYGYVVSQELDIDMSVANSALHKLCLVHFRKLQDNEIKLELITVTNIDKIIKEDEFSTNKIYPILTKIFI